MNTRSRRLAVTAMTTLLVLTACGGSGGDSDSPKTEESSTTPSRSPTSVAPTAPSGLTGRLMFSRFDEATHTFLSTHVALPDGSNENELTLPGPEGGGGWSHSGDLIAVMTILKDDRIGTAIIKPDGTVVRTLPIPDPTLNLVCANWSPDDKRLACEAWDETKPGRVGIYTVRASDGRDLVRLTAPPEGMVDFPGDYSPDGRTFVFKRTVEENPGPLMLVGTSGGKPRRLSPDQFEDAGRFSPDGRSVLTSQGGSIVVLDRSGTVRTKFEVPGTQAFGPDWSPDGEWIAFSRGTDGPFADIFVSRPDGSEEFQVTDDPLNEIALDWG